MEEFKTIHECDIDRRRERVKAKFLELRQQFPQTAYTTLCLWIAEDEKQLDDGIKSLSGVVKIIKLSNLQNL